MKKPLAFLFIFFLLTIAALTSANAEAIPDALQLWIPSEATILSDESLGAYRVLSMELPSGELLDLTSDIATSEPLSLATRTPVSLEMQQIQDRKKAEELVLDVYPGTWILSAREMEDGAKCLSLLSDVICGEVTVQNDILISRNLKFGCYAQEGVLTMDGALAAMKLLRPEAEFYALELDEDDGELIYEGNARVNGVEYEFELNARNARLLEWERD